jgi:hypothetical protein
MMNAAALSINRIDRRGMVGQITYYESEDRKPAMASA